MPDTADFMSQVVAWLEQSVALLSALGQTDATPKIFGDVADGSPSPPYLVITETNETPQYQGPDSTGTAYHFDRGTIAVHIFASGKTQARSIGRLVADQLNDAPIAPDDGTLLELRQSAAAFIPIGEIGPGTTTVTCRLLTFLYLIQRAG